MFSINLQQRFLSNNFDQFLSFKDTIPKTFIIKQRLFYELWPLRNVPAFEDVAVVSQGSADPGGEQVGPGGAQQHGDDIAHHEPAQ